MKRGKKSKKKIVAPKKKKVPKNKKISKKKVSKKKTSYNNKKLLAISITLFLVFAIALAFVNVPQNVSVTGEAVEGINMDSTQIGTVLTNIMNPENADPTIIKWIAFFTFALAIWAGISALGIKNAFLRLLALPFAFAMVYLLKPEEIFAGLIGYSALGMTLIVAAPFLAILFASVFLLEGRITAMKIIIQLMGWYFYLAFLIYFLIRAFFVTETYSLGILLIIAIGIILSLIIIWKNKPWRKWIATLKREAIEKATEDIQHALGSQEKGQQRRGEEILRQAEGKKEE